MWRSLMLLMLIPGFVLASDPHSGSPHHESELNSDSVRVIGHWAIQAWEKQGKIGGLPYQECRITKSTLAFGRKGQPLRKFKLDLNPTVNPHRFDLTNLPGERNLRVLGIYEIRGNQLILCWNYVGRERPTTLQPGFAKTDVLVTLTRIR